MKRIACTIKGVETLICINMVGRAEFMLIKTMQNWDGSGLVVGAITTWSGTNEGMDVIISVNMGGRAEVMFIKALETGGLVPPPPPNSKYSNVNTTPPWRAALLIPLACHSVDLYTSHLHNYNRPLLRQKAFFGSVAIA